LPILKLTNQLLPSNNTPKTDMCLSFYKDRETTLFIIWSCCVCHLVFLGICGDSGHDIKKDWCITIDNPESPVRASTRNG